MYLWAAVSWGQWAVYPTPGSLLKYQLLPFQAAVDAALPSLCVPAHLPKRPKGRTIIIGAGLPAEISFSEGHGCLGRVVFDSLGIDVDLENGGACVRLPALEPGTYGFRCGMDMVHGTLIAE